MKKFTKNLLAVAAMVAVSCTTDVTEDLGVNLNGTGQTEITLSLEESRTQLGEKAGNLYPLYWSEGDKISVNGVESNALTAEQSGKASATFSVATAAPYCIAYPAATEGQVLFAENQTHVGNGTFGSGVSTMYAYSENGLGAQLHHLTGVLKIGVVGSATLSHAQISTIDRAPIAGAFDFDFVKGEAKATDASKEVINYSFGEGVQLSDKVTYLHVAVPAGEYTELYVTLYDNAGGVMYATVKAGEAKPLAAGSVRTFSNNIEYVAKNEAVYVISNAATLKAFAAAAPTLEKDAVLVADVDMSAEEWAPIEGYAKTINGNGYAIKGLKTPLFGTTNAKIKGLHLTELDAEWATYTKAGAFAVHLAEGGSLSHCSTDGKININNNTYAEAVVRQQYDLMYGGLVAYATGATIEHCENNADITITSICAESVASSGSHLYGLSFGGVVGAAELLDGGSATSITHVRNNGTISIVNKTALGRGYHWMGGVFGQTINNNALSAFSHCYNYGDITTVKDSPLAAIRLGGVFGDLATNAISTIDYIENHGAINIHGTVASNTPQIYGIGYTAYVIDGVNDCLNTGDITVQTNAKSNMYVCGGILGITASSETKGICHRMKNEGDITVLPYNESSSITGTLYVVGLTNNLNCGIEGTADNLSGNSGNINVTSTSSSHTYVAGVAVTVGEGFAFKNVENSGAITLNSDVTGTNGDIYVSGVSTTIKASSSFTNVKNSGDITVGGSATRHVVVNGIGNEVRCTMNNVSNSGDVEVSAASGSNTLVYGVGRLIYAKATDVHNTGNVTVSGTATAGDIQAAGVFGALGNYAVTTDASNPSSNSGTITCRAKALNKDKAIRIAGYAVVLNYSKGMSNLLNKGNVICEGVTDNLAPIQLGGLACEINYSTSNSENRGAVSFSGSAANTVYASGIGVTMGANCTLTDVTNSGKISSTGSHAAQVRLAGIIGLEYAASELVRANNTGDIEMDGEVKSSIGIAGIWPVNQKADATFTDCHNSGAITVKSSTVNKSSNNIGGLVGYTAKNMTFDGCSNSGKMVDGVKKGIYVEQPVQHGYFDIGGCVGYVYGANKITFLNGFTNSADIHVKVTNTYAGTYPVGGVIATYQNSGASYEGWTGSIKNEGTITFDGDASASKTLAVGGIVGISGAVPCEATLVNTGNIIIKDTAKIPATNGFGGIFGIAAGSIKGAKTHCTIEKSDNISANFGWITGSARSTTVIASNCAIGGKHITGWNDEDDTLRAEGDNLDESNYMNYIYGAPTDWIGVENYDGCTHLSAKPE